MLQVENHSKINQEEERNTSEGLLHPDTTVVGDTLAHGQPNPQNCESTPSKEYGHEQTHENSVQHQRYCEPGETPDVQENVPKNDYRFVDDRVLVQMDDGQGYKLTSSTESTGEIPVIQEKIPTKDYKDVDNVVLVQPEDNQGYKLTPSHEPSIEPAQSALIGSDVTDYGSEKRRRRSSTDRTCDNIMDCMTGCCYCLMTCLQIALCCLGEDP